MRLAPRLAILFLAAGLVPLGVIVLVLAPRTQDALRSSARQLHQSEIASLQTRIDGRIEDFLADVRLLGAGREDDLGHAAQLRFLLDTHPELTALTLYRDGSKVAGAQVWDKSRITVEELGEHERRAWAMVGGGVAASHFHPSARLREMQITLLAPLGNRRVLA